MPISECKFQDVDTKQGPMKYFLSSSGESDVRINFVISFFTVIKFAIHTIRIFTPKCTKVWAVLGLP